MAPPLEVVEKIVAPPTIVAPGPLFLQNMQLKLTNYHSFRACREWFLLIILFQQKIIKVFAKKMAEKVHEHVSSDEKSDDETPLGVVEKIVAPQQ